MFIFLCFQYILIIFIFNCKSVHRKHFSTNSILIIILLLIILLIIQFLFFAENIDAPWIKALIQFEDAIEEFDFYSELNKLIIQSFVIVNLVLSLANELFIISKL